MFWKKKRVEALKPPETHFDTTSPKRKFIESVYQHAIRPKYVGLQFHDALPKVIMDLMEAYNNYENKDKQNTM